MQRSIQWQIAAGVAALAVSVTAGAAEPGASSTGFGTAGQFVISSDAQAGLGYTTEGDGGGFITLEPAVDYFLKEGLSVGGGVRLRAVFQDGEDPFGMSLFARAGYNIPLNERVSVWPKVGVALDLGDNLFSLAVPFGFGSDTTLVLEGSAPFLYHVTQHFFIGAGPRLAIGLGDDVDIGFSVISTVGGYF